MKMMMPQMDVAEYDKMKINNAVRLIVQIKFLSLHKVCHYQGVRDIWRFVS